MASATQTTVTFSAAGNHRPLNGPSLFCLVTEALLCENFLMCNCVQFLIVPLFYWFIKEIIIVSISACFRAQLYLNCGWARQSCCPSRVINYTPYHNIMRLCISQLMASVGYPLCENNVIRKNTKYVTSLYPSTARYQNSLHHRHFHCSLQARLRCVVKYFSLVQVFLFLFLY